MALNLLENNSSYNQGYQRQATSDDQCYFVLEAANGEPIGKSEIQVRLLLWAVILAS